MRTLASTLFASLAIHSAVAENALPAWALTLTDGSHIAFVPDMETLPINSQPLGTTVEVPVGAIAGITFRNEGQLSLKLGNGDRVSGRPGFESLSGTALFGPLQIEMRHLKDIDIVRSGRDTAKTEGPGEFQLDYAGLRWDTWRTGWAVDDDRLVSLRRIRPGFSYGHWANGRGGVAITGNGSKEWTDYELAFDYKMLPANRQFYHAHIPGETRAMNVFFRAKSLSESWNQPDTSYAFNLTPAGNWSITAYEGYYMPGNRWNAQRNGKVATLLTGKQEDTKDASQGRLRIRVKGNQMKAWLDEELLADFTHSEGETEPIPYGGFGVKWRYESMGEISNLQVERLAK